MMEAVWSARRVARQLGHSDWVVRRYWDQWIREMSFTRRPGSKRPRQTSRREEHQMVRNARVQPTDLSTAIQAQDSHGEIFSDPSDISKRWIEYFSDLLNLNHPIYSIHETQSFKHQLQSILDHLFFKRLSPLADDIVENTNVDSEEENLLVSRFLILRQSFEKFREFGIELPCFFTDFTTAYDSVDHDSLLVALAHKKHNTLNELSFL
ncbi:uncharacterized protein TNCV_4577541 [Trichonephila clavipes]|nr:uncharacterized protein TNCV_4577541 [Trichonephila clavipes]